MHGDIQQLQRMCLHLCSHHEPYRELGSQPCKPRIRFSLYHTLVLLQFSIRNVRMFSFHACRQRSVTNRCLVWEQDYRAEQVDTWIQQHWPV